MIQIHSQLVLEDAGFEVVQARDADSALSQLQNRPDVGALFTDVNLAGATDGLALAREVHGRRPDVSILVTSGAGDIVGDRLPANGRFIAKPYSSADVCRLLSGRTPDEDA